MTQQLLRATLLLLTTFTFGCKKSSDFDNIVSATWELRTAQSGMSPAINYPAGNGRLLTLGNGNYTFYENGSLVKAGTYVLTNNTPNLTGACSYDSVEYRAYKITFDNDNRTSKEVQLPDSNTMVFRSGCFALDSGILQIYKKQ